MKSDVYSTGKIETITAVKVYREDLLRLLNSYPESESLVVELSAINYEDADYLEINGTPVNCYRGA